MAKLTNSELKSKRQSSLSFAKQQTNAAAVTKTPGAEREALFVNYMVHGLRCKELNNTVSFVHSSSTCKIDTEQDLEVSEEMMDMTCGPKRAKGLRESGKVTWKPCPITGSSHEDMRLWIVPQKFTIRQSMDDKSNIVKSEGGMDDEEYTKMVLGEGAPACPVQVKEEKKPQTAEEAESELKEQFTDKTKLQAKLEMFQALELEATVLNATADTVRKARGGNSQFTRGVEVQMLCNSACVHFFKTFWDFIRSGRCQNKVLKTISKYVPFFKAFIFQTFVQTL